eukprot:1441284-Alexandrium_andersonii.AAC.1
MVLQDAFVLDEHSAGRALGAGDAADGPGLLQADARAGGPAAHEGQAGRVFRPAGVRQCGAQQR